MATLRESSVPSSSTTASNVTMDCKTHPDWILEPLTVTLATMGKRKHGRGPCKLTALRAVKEEGKTDMILTPSLQAVAMVPT